MLKMKRYERDIILQLIEDSRQPVSRVARKLGITRQTVAKKIEEFKKLGLISSFTTRLDPKKLGLTVKAYILMREEPRTELRRATERTIKGLRQVSRFYRLFGEYDAILEVLVKDTEELTRLVKKIHELEGVTDTETFIAHSTIKDEPEDPFIRILKTRRRGHVAP